MTLTATQYREIMNDYDRIRQANYQMELDRRAQVYARIPRIREIDEAMASESMEAAKKMLFAPEEDQRERLHEKIETLIREKKDLLTANHYPPDYLDPIWECPYCQDTGYVGDSKCLCFERRISELLSQQSNLTAEIDEQNFTNFKMEYYSTQIPSGEKRSPRDNMKEILDKVFDFIRNFKENPGRNLLIHGHSGVGKTYLSTCIAAELIKAGISVTYMTSYQLFEALADRTFGRGESEEDILELVRQTDLLIIDDLGTEMNNSFVNAQLFQCINERILRKKSTIINTNYSLNEISKTYSERISSRLIQFYTILHLYGEDIRIKKALSYIDARNN